MVMSHFFVFKSTPCLFVFVDVFADVCEGVRHVAVDSLGTGRASTKTL